MVYKKIFVSFMVLLSSILTTSCVTDNRSTFNFERSTKYKNYTCGCTTGEKPIIWGTEESTKMIKETQYSKPFFALLPHFAIQSYLTTCGIASARIVVSAIYDRTNTPMPIDRKHSNLKESNGFTMGRFVFTEENFMDIYDGDDENKDYEVIARLKKRKNGIFAGGISISNLTELLNLYPNVKAEYFEIQPTLNFNEDINKFRETVKDVMKSDGKYMIANYHMCAILPKVSGHYSPIVAYDEKSDMVLIMDVAGHLATWHWVKVEELYKSMNSVLSGINRGYIIIEEVNDEKNTEQNIEKK